MKEEMIIITALPQKIATFAIMAFIVGYLFGVGV